MLISINSDKKVTHMPHKAEFDRWRKNISDEDYEKVTDAINDQIDAKDVNTAGWMPGKDWTGTVYEPLYHACGQNTVASGLFFGLIVYKTLMERTDHVWGFIRLENIRSMTYFITNKDPKDL